MLINKKFFIYIPISFFLFSNNISYANSNTDNTNIEVNTSDTDILDENNDETNGIIHIKSNNKIISNKMEEKDEELNQIGNIKISDINLEKILNPHKKKNIPSSEAEKIISVLSSIEIAQKTNDFETALEKTTLLSKQYPESILFKKWKAIFENHLGYYEDSINSILLIKRTFPMDFLEEDKIKNLEYNYYMIDNYRNLNQFEKSLLLVNNILEILNSNKNNNNNNTNTTNNIDYLSFNSLNNSNPEIFLSVFLFQKLLINKSLNNNEINEIDLNKVWNMIPSYYQRSLKNYYGFDLSELEYEYGIYYKRKDILKAYVEQNESSNNQKTIEKIKNAKNIIFEEY